MKFYPSGNKFTQALLVMLVTNIICDSDNGNVDGNDDDSDDG